MATIPKALVLTASIDDEAGLLRWAAAMQAAGREVQEAVDRARELLLHSPFVHITLSGGGLPVEGEGAGAPGGGA